MAKEINLYDIAFAKKGRKRSLGITDRKRLWNKAEKKCEACLKPIDFDEMQTGHKNRAFARGGATKPENSVCLCYKCNNLQGTSTFRAFLKATYPKRYQELYGSTENKESRPKKKRRNYKHPERFDPEKIARRILN